MLRAAVTGWMEANADQAKYSGGADIKIPLLTMDGLGNYNRESGYPEGSASLEFQTMRMTQDSHMLDLLCCIPVEDGFDGPERMEFPETPALCIYYRGPYEGTATAIRALVDYVKENNIKTTGAFRSIFLEGPPSRGANSGDYITQIAVPVKA